MPYTYHRKTGPRSEQGFTLIELVMVIVILGVLAAFALPRFADLSDQAELAVAEGVAAAFRGGVSQVKLRWQASGASGRVINLAGFGQNNVDTSSTGYPLGTRKTNNNDNIQFAAAGCADLWNGLMESPPPVGTTLASEWQAFRHTANRQCDFVYRKGGDTAGRVNAQLVIRYNANNGEVRVCGRRSDIPNC